jgi:DNA-binding winged helix-turn-helix (wHTH) protein
LIFLFENHRLDPERRELICAGESVPLEPQVFDVLLYLLEHRDRVVGKDELFDKVWDGRIVSESTLTSRINAVRRAINDTGKEQRLLRTIARKGFRFVGDVEVERPAAAPPTDHAASQDGEPPRLSLPASTARLSRCCLFPISVTRPSRNIFPTASAKTSSRRFRSCDGSM